MSEAEMDELEKQRECRSGGCRCCALLVLARAKNERLRTEVAGMRSQIAQKEEKAVAYRRERDKAQAELKHRQGRAER